MNPVDLGPPNFLIPALFFVVLLLALVVAFLGREFDRAKRSLALLIVLISSLGILSQLMNMKLGSGISLALFLGMFVVFFLMGRFDSPEKK